MRELERFGLWLKRRRPRPKLEDVDGPLIIRYIRDRTPFHAKATLCSIVSDLRGMGEFLVREGIWPKNPLRWIKGPKLDPRSRVPRRIGKEHLKRIWDAAGKRPTEYARHQAICVLAVLYGTGLRRGEIERLDVKDWDRGNGVLSIDGQKTGRPRQVPVGASVWRCIEAYLPHRQKLLEQRGTVEEGALFVNRYGTRLKSQDISGMAHRLARAAGVPLVSLHQFRHTCASDLLSNGVRLPEVQKILGHATIESTVRYIHVAAPERKEAIAKHPINEFLGNDQPQRRAIS
jgi:site-specific recombinase XerD